MANHSDEIIRHLIEAGLIASNAEAEAIASLESFLSKRMMTICSLQNFLSAIERRAIEIQEYLSDLSHADEAISHKSVASASEYREESDVH